jgi:hypothetical protein
MNARKITSGLVIVLLCVLFGGTSRLIVSPTNYPNSDFFSFWLSGRMLQSYQNPYEAEGWVEAHHTYGAKWISDPTFLYPIPLAILFIPFGAFDLYPAFVAWVWLSQILLLISALILFPLLGENRKHFIVPVALGILLYRPVISLLVNGQLSAIFLLAIVGAGRLWERGRWFWGGAALSILLLKPSIGVPIIALAGLFLLVRKSYRGLAGVGAGGMGILLVGLLLNPNWVSEYLGVVQSKQSETFGYSSTLWGLSGLAVGFDPTYTILLGAILTLVICTLYFLAIRRWKTMSPLHGLALSVAVALFVTPYLWPYDQVLLWLPMTLSMPALIKQRAPYLVSALLFLGVDIIGWLLFGWSATIRMENPNSLMTLLVLGLFAIILRREQAASRMPENDGGGIKIERQPPGVP